MLQYIDVMNDVISTSKTRIIIIQLSAEAEPSVFLVDDERGGIFTPSHLSARSTQESARHQANLGRAKTSGSTFYQTRNQYMEQQNFQRFGQDEGFVKV